MFTDPLKNLKLFDLREDMILVDLGAGTGFYSILASPLLPKGKVYAIEINRDYIKTIRNKIKDEGITNVECFWGNIEKKEGTMLRDKIADRVIISNVLFQVEDRNAFLSEVDRILKDRGKILLIDFNEDSIIFKKQKDRFIKEKDAKELLSNFGFIWERNILAGANHYGMIFNKVKTLEK